MAYSPFVPLRVFSSFTMLEGAIEPKAIAKAARERGFPAVAVADRNGLYGVMAFGDACKAAGVQPIAGTFLSVARPGQRLANGADFAAEARNVSHAPSAPRGGALTWYSFPEPAEAGRTNGLPLPIARVLPTLTPGATSSPILLDDKSWALIRLDETRPTQIPDYEATRPALLRVARAEVAALAGKRLADRLLRDARIEWAAGLDPEAGASGEGGRCSTGSSGGRT